MTAKGPAQFKDVEVNLRSFQQMRCLCLVALIFIHCISFSTSYYRQRLDETHLIYPLLLLALLNSLFVFMTGVTLRLSLSGNIRGHRLQPGTFLSGVDTFLILIVIETFKNLLLYDNPAVALSWDFIRTIFCAYVITYAIARVNIYLNLLVAALVGFFYSDLHHIIRNWIWRPNQFFETAGDLNAVHFTYLGLLAAISAYFVFRIWHQGWPKPLKQLATTAILFLVAPLAWKTLNLEPDFAFYQHARTWMIQGLIGNSDDSTLMPLLAWGPSFLIGFAGTHFLLQYRSFFEEFRAAAVALSTGALYIAGYIGCIYFFPQFALTGYVTWKYVAQSQTSFTGELLKISYFLMFFCSFIVMNHHFIFERFNLLCMKMGRASFWIYILATSWTPWISAFTIEKTHSFALGLSVTILTTLLSAWVLAEGIFWLSTKTLRLKLKRVSP